MSPEGSPGCSTTQDSLSGPKAALNPRPVQVPWSVLTLAERSAGGLSPVATVPPPPGQSATGSFAFRPAVPLHHRGLKLFIVG
jgi:hypothetical protein